MRVFSIDWTPKTGNNAIVLVQHSSALISFTTHTQKYEFNLAGLFEITDTIGSHINTIENNCLKLNDVSCEENVIKLNEHVMSLNEKIISISNLEQNCLNLRSKKDLNIEKATKEILDKVNSLIYKMDNVTIQNNLTNSKTINNFNIQVCTLELMNCERKILDIQNLLIENDSTSLLKIIDETILRTDIFKSSFRNDSIKSFSTEETCGNFLDTHKLISKLIKISEISSEIINSKVVITIRTPILEQRPVKVYKLIKTPVTIHDETIIIKNLPDNVIIGCNDTITGISNTKLKHSVEILDGYRLIQLNELDETDNSCPIKPMLLNNFKRIDYVSCDVSNIFHTNYIIPLTNNFYYIHTVKPVTLRASWKNNTNKLFTFKSSGILEIKSIFHIKIDEYYDIVMNEVSPTKEIIANEYALNTSIENYYSRAKNPQIFFKTEIVKIENTEVDFEIILSKIDAILMKNEIYDKIGGDNAYQIQIMIISCIISAIVSMGFTVVLLFILYKKITNTKHQIKFASKLIRSLNKLE